jgi:diguanylate cyclase (GGDEF)-like protein/PAS domain S-box-containing protein
MHSGGRFRGVIGIGVLPNYLSDELALLRVDDADILAVVRPDGTFVARSRRYEEAIHTPLPADRPFRSAGAGQSGIFRSQSAVDKQPLVFAWRRLTDWPLIVVAAVDEERELGLIRDHWTQERRQAVMFLGLLLSTFVGAALFLFWMRLQEQRLARSERLHRALFAESRTAMLLIDPRGGAIVDANQVAQQFYGYTHAQLTSMRISEINVISPAQVDAAMRRASAGEQDRFIFQHRLASGELRHVEVSAGTIETEGGTYLYSIIQDVTARLASAALAAAESARLAAVLETASDGIHVLDEQGNLTHFSASFATMLGYDPQELKGRNVALWDAHFPIQELVPTVNALMVQGRRFETRHRRKDGSLIDVEIQARGFEIGGCKLLYNGSRDITERKLAEQQLRIAAAAFDSQQGIVVTDPAGIVLRVNRAFSEITGHAPDEVIGRNPSVLASGRQDRSFYAAMWQCIETEGSWSGELWNRRASGEEYAEWLTITAVKSAGGEVTHYVGTFTDITIRKSAEDEVHRLAFYDPLTRLPNRRLLLDRLKQALAVAARSGRQGAVLFIDLDNFKSLNDTLGHDVGDHLLRQVAQRLTNCLREGETACRLGGDEFVVMLENLSADPVEVAAQVESISERFVASLNRPYQFGRRIHHSTSSIGVALFDGRSGAVEEILQRADVAMYQAKADGRNAVRFFDPVMQAVVSARVALEADIRESLQRGDFSLAYQCQVDSAGRMRGAEALLRWRHPTRGDVAPAEFIPVAEDTGLIVPLGLWVLNTACARLAAWACDPRSANLMLAVNVSPRQFGQADFVDQVRHALAESHADARLLTLELTESMLVSNVDDVIAKMNALKAIGVGFALDDFGTGYSSLAYISRLPLEQLKIDRSFVAQLESSANARAICAATIGLAHSLNLEVVAEGVETEAQRRFLVDTNRCDLLQGYLFGKPLVAAEFEMSVARAAEAPTFNLISAKVHRAP